MAGNFAHHDGIRRSIRVRDTASKLKWHEENWGNQNFDKLKTSLQPKVESLSRSDYLFRGGDSRIKDLDIPNWKEKEDL